MLAALFTAFLFSFSAILGEKSARIYGAAKANFGRLLVAFAFLAVWAFLFGQGLHGPGLYWFIFSGFIGFGLGDLALFAAFTRIGPRLTILLTQCLAGPIAGLAEWLWLGQSIPLPQIVAAGIILLGIFLALNRGKNQPPRPNEYALGIFFGILSALGQGLGAVLSRKALIVSHLEHFQIDGGTAAFQRMLGGIVVALLFYWLTPRLATIALPDRSQKTWFHTGWWIVLLNGLAGPCLGVAFFQAALVTTPSAIVLAIVSTSPVIVLILQILAKREKPSALSILGSLIAVVGAILLALLKN